MREVLQVEAAVRHRAVNIKGQVLRMNPTSPAYCGTNGTEGKLFIEKFKMYFYSVLALCSEMSLITFCVTAWSADGSLSPSKVFTLHTPICSGAYRSILVMLSSAVSLLQCIS